MGWLPLLHGTQKEKFWRITPLIHALIMNDEWRCQSSNGANIHHNMIKTIHMKSYNCFLWQTDLNFNLQTYSTGVGSSRLQIKGKSHVSRDVWFVKNDLSWIFSKNLLILFTKTVLNDSIWSCSKFKSWSLDARCNHKPEYSSKCILIRKS